LAGGQLNEGPEVHNAHNLAQIYVAHLDILGDALDDLARLGGGGLVGGGDVDAAIVLDVDLHARFGDDLVDHLAARSDDLADLFGVDGEAHDLGRVAAQVLARLVQRIQHDLEDVQAARQRLAERL